MGGDGGGVIVLIVSGGLSHDIPPGIGVKGGGKGINWGVCIVLGDVEDSNTYQVTSTLYHYPWILVLGRGGGRMGT